MLLWPMLAVAILFALYSLPMEDREYSFLQPQDVSHNWFGQGMGAIYAYFFLLLLLAYTAKFVIGYLPVRWLRVYCFVLLVIASLPYIWFLLSPDWNNPHVSRFSCWVHDPVGFWFIPTVSFVFDTSKMRTPQTRRYSLRSFIEWLLFIPWIFVWGFVSFFVLGGGWI
jgi:hypothetical protein